MQEQQSKQQSKVIWKRHQGNDLQCRSSHSFEPVLSTSPSTTRRSPLLRSHDSLSQNLPTIVHPAAHLNPPVQVTDHNCYHPSPSLSSSLFPSSHKGATFRSVSWKPGVVLVPLLVIWLLAPVGDDQLSGHLVAPRAQARPAATLLSSRPSTPAHGHTRAETGTHGRTTGSTRQGNSQCWSLTSPHLFSANEYGVSNTK